MVPGFSRRPATRERISSAQKDVKQEPAYDFVIDDRNHPLMQGGGIRIDDDDIDNNSFHAGECHPQFDNPSQMFPGDENDTDAALEQFLSDQQEQQEEFNLDVIASDDEDVENEAAADNNDNSLPFNCTQGALDPASVLAAGFAAGEEDHSNEEQEQQQQQEVSEQPPSNLAASIAQQLRKDGLAGSGLDEDELKFIDECLEGKNTAQCDATKKRLELRFFDTLDKCGGNVLSSLAKDTLPNPHDLHEKNCIDRSFYAIVGGAKDADKHEMLNKCFSLCGMKWECLTGERKGKAIQPVSFVKMMQLLAFVFKDKGTEHLFNEDFNKQGEFHGLVKKKWKEMRKTDPTFGTGSKRARVEKTLVRKFVEAIRNGALLPYEDPEHCLVCVMFIIGRCCALRASKEHIDLDIANVCLGEHTTEDGVELAGLKQGGVKVPFSKTNDLNMNKTRPPRDKDVLLAFVETPEHDCFDPHAAFVHCVAHCHPRAKKFYGRLVKQGEKLEGGRLAKEFGKPIWHAESGHDRANWNLGPDKHRSLCKMTAQHAGVENWNQCAGHSLRALCVATCIGANLTAVDAAKKVRHSSTNTQKDCAHDCSERLANRVLCLTENPRKRAAAPEKVVADDVVVVETQPMLPQNRHLFEQATKKRAVAVAAESQEEGKENAMVDDLDVELSRLKKKNEILRLRKEQLQLEQDIAARSGRVEETPLSPRRRPHGRSCPPSGGHHHFAPSPDECFCHPPRNDGCRHSCPFPPPPPRGPPSRPRHQGDHRACPPPHCDDHHEEDCGDCHGEHAHRR